jgi:hypothetical protein
MHLREQGPGAIRGFAFKDATPDRPSPASSARRKSSNNNKEKPRLKALPGRRVFLIRRRQRWRHATTFSKSYTRKSRER